MPAAEDVQSRLRQDGLDKDFQRPATDQSAVVARFVIQIEGHFAGRLRFEYVFRSCPNFGFDAAAADCSQNGPVLAHQHSGTLKAGDRAIRVNDGGHYGALAFAPEPQNFLEKIHGRSPPAWLHYSAGCRVSVPYPPYLFSQVF